jgi:hypothetical protein
MKRKGFAIHFFSLILASTAGLFFCLTVFAQEAPPETPQKPPEPRKPSMLDTAGRMKIFFRAGYGVGFDSVHVGDTTAGEDVTLSGGGGPGLVLGIGYGLSGDFDLDLDFGGQVSTLTPQVSNADGSLSRSFLLVTIRKKFPTSKTGQFKAGIGAGIYSKGELDFDWTGAQGNHEIVKYNDAFGIHFTGEFEQFITANTSFSIGGKVYLVNYKANSYTIDGLQRHWKT